MVIYQTEMELDRTKATENIGYVIMAKLFLNRPPGARTAEIYMFYTYTPVEEASKTGQVMISKNGMLHTFPYQWAII